jgi:hypothetical protein
MQQIALDCLKLKQLKQEGFILVTNLPGRQIHLIPVYYRSREENVLYRAFI